MTYNFGFIELPHEETDSAYKSKVVLQVNCLALYMHVEHIDVTYKFQNLRAVKNF